MSSAFNSINCIHHHHLHTHFHIYFGFKHHCKHDTLSKVVFHMQAHTHTHTHTHIHTQTHTYTCICAAALQTYTSTMPLPIPRETDPWSYNVTGSPLAHMALQVCGCAQITPCQDKTLSLTLCCRCVVVHRLYE